MREERTTSSPSSAASALNASAPWLHQLIEMQAGECPRDVAAIFEGDRLTYGDLDRRANRLAHQLCELGVTPETPVGIFMDRSLELVVSILAVLKAGGACVPLEPSYPDTWLSYVAEDVALSVILTQPPLRPRLAAGHAQVLTVGLDALDDGPSTNPEVDIDFENAAFVFYTSGSTGQPKGVVSTHGARAERMQWTQAHYPALPGSRHILKTSIGFNRLVREYFCPLTTGGCMVVARPGGNQDCVYLLDLIRRHEVQAINFAPSMLRVFLEEPGLESCPSLRHVMCTGEALPVDLQRRFFQRLPHAKLHAFYGASEVPMAMYWDCRPDEDRLLPTAGLPAGTNIYLLDDQQRPVGEGAMGEIHVGGRGLARGYVGRSDLTAERFVPNPFAEIGDDGEVAGPSLRLYRTGDLGRFLQDGTIELLGRSDGQVQIRGMRVELGEVEAALGLLPAVRDRVVIARSDAPGGEVNLVAYVVLDPAAGVTVSDLRHDLLGQLRPHMVPAQFVIMDSIPLNANGKVDRQALPEPDGSRPILAVSFVPPSTPTEERVAELCSALLGVSPIGIHDDLFEMGGQSLTATLLVSRLRDAFDIELPMNRIMEAPTVGQLAQLVDATLWAGSSVDQPVESTDGEPADQGVL